MSNRHFIFEARSVSPISNWIEIDRLYGVSIDTAQTLLTEHRYSYEGADNQVRLVELFGSEEGGTFIETRCIPLDL